MKWLLVLALLPIAAMAEEAAPAAEGNAKPRPVVSEVMALSHVGLRDSVGIVEAQIETVLAFQTLGRLAERPVKAGDRVTEGQHLARLDQVTLAEDLASAKAAVTSAEVQMKIAEAALLRAQELLARGVASQARLEAAQRTRDSATAGLEAARADLDRAQDAAGFADLTAPAAGIVLETLAEPGQVVSTGQPVLRLAVGDARDVVIDLPSAEAEALPADARFDITQAGDGPAIAGTLRLVDPISSAATRARRVRISLPEGLTGFRIGSLIHAQLASQNAEVFSLPETAIFGDPAQVWRVTPNTRAVEAVPVTETGAAGEGRIAITGLAAGDEIVTRGAHSLQAGVVVGERVK